MLKNKLPRFFLVHCVDVHESVTYFIQFRRRRSLMTMEMLLLWHRFSRRPNYVLQSVCLSVWTVFLPRLVVKRYVRKPNIVLKVV